MSDVVQLSFDYSVLTAEQAQRTQEAEYRIIGRTQKTVVENGRDLLAVKQDIGHGHFQNWIRSLGISETTSQSWMGVAEKFIEMPDSRAFETRALYLLSTSKVPESARQEAKDRAASGETITEDVAKQIRDAHKAKEQAEKEAELANQQLWQTQDVLKTRSEQLNAKIDNLQLQIKNLESQLDSKEPSPKVEKQIKELTQQRNNLSQLVEDLGKDLETLREETEVKRAQEMQDLRIRQNWRTITDAFHKQVLKLLSQFPTSIDTQVFESEDWDRLSQAQELARRFQAECSNLNSRSMSFVDAG